jgi:hypothetical protein
MANKEERTLPYVGHTVLDPSLYKQYALPFSLFFRLEVRAIVTKSLYGLA